MNYKNRTHKRSCLVVHSQQLFLCQIIYVGTVPYYKSPKERIGPHSSGYQKRFKMLKLVLLCISLTGIYAGAKQYEEITTFNFGEKVKDSQRAWVLEFYSERCRS